MGSAGRRKLSCFEAHEPSRVQRRLGGGGHTPLADKGRKTAKVFLCFIPSEDSALHLLLSPQPLNSKSGLTFSNASSTSLCCLKPDISKHRADCCPPLPSPNPPASSPRHSRQSGLSPFVTICMLLGHTMTIRTKIPLGLHSIVPMQCNLAAHRECSRKTAGKMVMGNHTLRLQESGVSLCTVLEAKRKWDTYTCTCTHMHTDGTRRLMGVSQEVQEAFEHSHKCRDE